MMTSSDWWERQSPTNRDEQIARILGWTRIWTNERGQYGVPPGAPNRQRRKVPYYSTDIAAAMSLLEMLPTMGWEAKLKVERIQDDTYREVQVWNHDQEFSTFGGLFPNIIAEAVFLALKDDMPERIVCSTASTTTTQTYSGITCSEDTVRLPDVFVGGATETYNGWHPEIPLHSDTVGNWGEGDLSEQDTYGAFQKNEGAP